MERQNEGLSNHDLQHEKELKKLEEEHKGHESMHTEMVLIFFITLIVAQIVLVQWKNKHPKSYNIATLFGMWLVPIIYTIRKLWWRFIFSWCIYTLVTSLVIFKARKKTLSGSTPRLVYRWFLLLFRVSYATGIIGYTCLMLTFFGVNLLLLISPETALDFGILLLFYGLYYGIISRDFAEICSESMASTIGYYTKTGIPNKQLSDDVCAICGLEIVLPQNDEDTTVERVYKLTCYHTFHDACIRGWCIVGKKQTCPYCKEKVDLKRMFKSPWERPHLMYGQLLDWMRYLVAWQPVIIFIVQVINWSLGLKFSIASDESYRRKQTIITKRPNKK